MNPFKSTYVKEENQRFFVITQWAYIIGFIGHVSAYFRFEGLGIDEMRLLNLFYSVPSFTIAFLLNRYGKHNAAFTLAFFELLIHQIFATYYLSWASGAHYWLIYLTGLCFFNPKWNTKLQIGLLALILASFVYMFFNFQIGVYQVTTAELSSNNLGSAVMTITITALLINYYSKATRKANNQLKEEKDKTDKMLNKVEALFGQQVSEEIANELISSDLDFGSKQYDVSIMFLDIRDFTVFADSHEPKEVAEFQNAVFSELIGIVKKHQGVVLQILGDGIMAVFGAPKVDLESAQKAVNAGQEMIIKIKELSDQEIIPPINVGIGVNSGKVIAGNVGNQSRRFYSLTGKNVIIAARIEQLNKQFKTNFLISQFTYEKLIDKPEVEFLGETPLKGIENKIGIYKVI